MRTQGSAYVLITGLVLHSLLHWPSFALHANASMVQALRAPGNRFAEACMIDNVRHTLSIWYSRDAMLAYLRSGAHAQALRALTGIGHGKTHGIQTDMPPGWSDVPRIYAEHARPV